MKIASCHKSKFMKHSVTGLHICSVCGYAANGIEIDPKKWKRVKCGNTYVYEEKPTPNKK